MLGFRLASSGMHALWQWTRDGWESVHPVCPPRVHWLKQTPPGGQVQCSCRKTGVLPGAAKGHGQAAPLPAPHLWRGTACPGPALDCGRRKSSLEPLRLPPRPTIPPAPAQDPHGLADEVSVATAWPEHIGDVFTPAEEDEVPGFSPARDRSFVGAAWGTEPRGTAVLARETSATGQCWGHTPD